ncbi:MAG: MFS transporter [Bacteroidales bacterium]|nr:MFS transporter [Bacteroidales bacterium]
MELSLIKPFGTDREERRIIGMLSLQSVLIGIYYGIYNIFAHAVFLSRFDETRLARAYILSALTGIGLTYLYSVFRPKLRFSSFSVINLVFVFLVTIFLWLILATGVESWMVYTIFIMLGPLFILIMLGYNGTTSNLFTLRQERKRAGITDAGIVLGMIISSFSVPALLSFKMDTHNMLLISAGSILIAILIQQGIMKRQVLKINEKEYPDEAKINLKAFRDNSFIRSMGVFIILSVLAVFFIQYSFMAVTRIRYPEEIEMAKFLGFFEGGMMLFTLLFYAFLFPYLITKQGLIITLGLSPVLIGLITIVALVTGSTGGFMTGTSGFLLFFLILALSRFFSRALNLSVEKPAFRILYEALGEKMGKTVQFALGGSVNEIGALISGLLLTGLGALTFFKLIHFSWMLMIIILFWLVTAMRLYREYRESVKETLQSVISKSEEEREEKTQGIFNSVSSSGLFIANNYYDLITNSHLHENITGNKLLLQQLINTAQHSLNPDILPLLKYLKSGVLENNGISAKLNSAVNNIELILDNEGLGKRIDLLSTIEESHNRKLHLQAIMSQKIPPVVTDLLKLIRDQDIEIIRETIYIAGKFRVTELLPEICVCMHNPLIARDAFSVLKSFGEEAFPAMAIHYYRSSGNTMVRRLIIRLFSEAGGRKAIDYLLPKLSSVHRLLKKEAATGLARCGYRADDENRKKIHQEIKDIIGLITWNLSAQITLKNNNDRLLYEAIEEDNQWWEECMFDMMALIYNRESIDQIKENLRTGTVESMNFALEMLDIFVDEEIKPQLVVLLNNEPPGNKVKNLFQFYPGNIPAYESLVQELVNKDYNHIGVWTKVCAIRSLYGLPRPDETDFLVALLFGVHRILREEACKFLQENYDDVYKSCSYRLPNIYRKQLDELLADYIKDNELLYNKLKSLSKIFPGISRNNLINMAEDLILVNEKQLSSLDPGADFMIWPVDYGSENNKDALYFNWHTTGHKLNAKIITNRPGEYYLLYIRDIEQFVFYEPEILPLLVKYMDNILVEEIH